MLCMGGCHEGTNAMDLGYHANIRGMWAQARKNGHPGGSPFDDGRERSKIEPRTSALKSGSSFKKQHCYNAKLYGGDDRLRYLLDNTSFLCYRMPAECHPTAPEKCFFT